MLPQRQQYPVRGPITDASPPKHRWWQDTLISIVHPHLSSYDRYQSQAENRIMLPANIARPSAGTALTKHLTRRYFGCNMFYLIRQILLKMVAEISCLIIILSEWGWKQLDSSILISTKWPMSSWWLQIYCHQTGVKPSEQPPCSFWLVLWISLIVEFTFFITASNWTIIQKVSKLCFSLSLVGSCSPQS